MPEVHFGHDVSKKLRTTDIKHHGVLSFEDLLISPEVLKGLNNAGFVNPSPIQLKAIPLGRCGLDLIVQAKSGTGKTCVFAVICLESIKSSSSSLQALILSPTREIALQSQRVIKTLGSFIEGLSCHTFIGGIHRSEDLKNLKMCHVAVGSPGRIKYLIEEGFMKTNSIRLLVLDEVDLLMTDAFQPTINWIFSSLPLNKQVVAVSATYTESMVHHLSNYMKNPTFVRLNASDPALLGIRQFYYIVPHHHLQHVVFQTKVSILTKILSCVEFQQCLVFSNYHSRTQDLCEALTQQGWPVSYISGSLEQSQRIQAYDQLTQFQCRVLVSTDLTSRGIDAENVNLVINLDIPWDNETYLHRIGRAGRYGSYGAAISLVSAGDELSLLQRHEKKCKTTIVKLPTEPIPRDLAQSECSSVDLDKLVSVKELSSGASGDTTSYFLGDRASFRKYRTTYKKEKSELSEESHVKGIKSEIRICDDDAKDSTSNISQVTKEVMISELDAVMKKEDTEQYVTHMMKLRSNFKMLYKEDKDLHPLRMTFEEVRQCLQDLSLSDQHANVHSSHLQTTCGLPEETINFSTDLNECLQEHVSDNNLSKLLCVRTSDQPTEQNLAPVSFTCESREIGVQVNGNNWTPETTVHSYLGDDKPQTDCELRDRSSGAFDEIEDNAKDDNYYDDEEEWKSEVEEEEEKEEEYDSDGDDEVPFKCFDTHEIDPELAFLQQEYCRLNKWAEYYSSEYERSCIEYDHYVSMVNEMEESGHGNLCPNSPSLSHSSDIVSVDDPDLTIQKASVSEKIKAQWKKTRPN